ncbi:MAG TPA: DnaB helicase C-terminal domain-containing protein [Ignavibacteriales bacterium]|nr:DnaB helicase C-terminal domain-containing protein [Ignavibacteriales bacterium]
MIDPKEKYLLELSLLKGILDNKQDFFLAISNGFSPELFDDPRNATLAKHFMGYYEATQKAPAADTLYEYLFISPKKVSDQEFKSFYQRELSNPFLAPVRDVKERLMLFHDDKSEQKLRKLVKGVDSVSGQFQGLDLLVQMNKQITELIYEHCYKYTQARNNYDVAESLVKSIVEQRSGKAREYIPTGFKYIDRKIIGFHRKNIAIIGARPSMGKTAFMLQLKRNLCRAGYKVGIFSIEMDAESLMSRDLSEATGIDSLRIDSGQLTDEEMELVNSKAIELADMDFVVDDNGYQTAETITTTAHHWKLTGKADIILIDYLGLIKITSNKGRHDLDLGEITGAFREFSKATGVPVVIFAQLNREVEKRLDKRPMLSDLRDSGNIEQDANTVMFLYRPDYYALNPFKEEKNKFFTKEGQLVDKSEYFEVIIAKQRRGKIGTVPLRYQKHLHHFETLEVRHAEDEATAKILDSFADPF